MMFPNSVSRRFFRAISPLIMSKSKPTVPRKSVTNLQGESEGGVTKEACRYCHPESQLIKKFSTHSFHQSKMPSLSQSEKLVLRYSKAVPEAYPPTKGSVKAAGYDLKSAFDCTIPAHGKAIVDTGLKIELPTGCYGRIAPRSGLAAKNFIDVGAGVVDEDYRGVLKVVLFNHGSTDFEVKQGDRIAQLICERIYYPELEEVKELTETQRGDGGFGSTGTN